MAEFVTRDSGERAEFSSGMVRDTEQGKPRFDLLRPLGVPYRGQFLVRCAALMARGAEKYGDRNWERADSAEELARMRSSAERHFNQWLSGVDDGEDHAAAVLFGLLAAETVAWKMAAREAVELYRARPDLYDPDTWPAWARQDSDAQT